MPIYEYGCTSCGHELEAWQKISEKPKRKCPACGAMRLERLISNTSFHLKGSGWYVTDYANKGKKPKESKPTTKPVSTPKKEKTDKSSAAKD